SSHNHPIRTGFSTCLTPLAHLLIAIPSCTARLPTGSEIMAARKPLVIVTRKLPEAVETRMRELFDARLNVEDKPMSRTELAEALATADVLVPNVTDRIDGELIAKAGPNLKLIANFGTEIGRAHV